jgi:hypothetical protein
MTGGRARSAVTAVLFLCAAAQAGPARAAGLDADGCASAAEKGQDLRWAGRLLAASTELRTCIDRACPAIIRSDCARWTAEVESATPTIVIRARASDGRDLVAARVRVDGELLEDALDGRAHALDPGEHLLRFEADGAPPSEERVVVREGEKLRVVDVVLGPWPSPAPAPPSRPERSSPPRPRPNGWTWALGGAALAAGGAGAWLLASSLSDYRRLQRSCGVSGSCTAAQVDDVRNRVWAGDVALIGAAALAAGALWVTFRADGSSAQIQVGGRL